MDPPVPAALPSIPLPLTSCVGRARDVAEVRRRLDAARLLTLTGVGGVGKTRLALEVAAAALSDYADGARFVDLAPVADAALVPQLTASACGVREEPGRPLVATLAGALRPQRLLLVLDNCEHLVAACAALADALLQTCPHLRILATSQESLGVAGEMVWPVAPLAIEPPQAAETFAESGAVALFVERARAGAPGFALGPGDRALVAEICRRLDGLPLAIELAAARTRALTLPELLRRLDDRFRLLTAGSRTSSPHQHTLRAAMDWSHDLLTEPERALLRRLAVFAGGAGGFTLQAAEVVCGDDDVLDLLTRLVDKSLVSIAAPAGAGRPTRYGLLETVRQYGLEKLHEAGEGERFVRQHAAYYLSVAEAAALALTGPEQATWVARLDAEHDNMRLALRWVVEGGDVTLGWRLGAALWRYWQARGQFSEGQQWLEAALARGDDAPAGERAAALTAAGNLALARGAPATARRFHAANLAVWRAIGDKAGIATALRNLGLVAVDQGDRDAARTLFEESLTLERELGDRWRIALALHCLGALARDEGDLDRARSRADESLALFRALGDTRSQCPVLMTLGSVALDRGDLAQARARNEESLEAYRALGDQRGIALALNQLAKVAYAAGEYAAAATSCAGSLTRAVALDIRRVAISGVEVMAAIAHQQGQDEVSVQLFGAAAALRQAAGTAAPPAEQRLYDLALEQLRAHLDEAAYAAAWEAGRAMPAEQATALALQVEAAAPSDVAG